MGISIDYYTNYEIKEMIEKYNRFIEEYKDTINKLVAKAFKIEGFNLPNVYIGIGVVTEQEIKEINKEYRGIDAPTDVLSFPIFSKKELAKMKEDKHNEETSIGDIVLCMDVIEKHAIEFGTGFNREMLYMIVHGVCHLLGFDHENEQDKKEMRVIEEAILEGSEK